MNAITVIGVERTIKNIGRYITWANITIPNLTEEQANDGARMARFIAPKSSGRRLVQAINVTPGRKNTEWMVVSRTPKNQVDIMGRPTKRMVPYQLYLHLGLRGRYKGSKKTGDHQYMYTTGNYLRQKYSETIRKSLRQVSNK